MISRRLLQQDHDRLFGGSPPGLRRLKEEEDKDGKDNKNEEEDDNPKEEKPDDDEGAEEDNNWDPLAGEKEEVEKEEEDSKEKDAEISQQPPETAGQGVETRIDLIKLVPFDVKLSLISDEDLLNSFALTDIVSDWMDESIAAQVKRMELGLEHVSLESVLLEERSLITPGADTVTSQRTSEGLSQSNVIASYEGVTLWRAPKDLQPMSPSIVEDIERQALLQDDRLLELLQASKADGLGDKVHDVRAYINPNPTYIGVQPNNPAPPDTSRNANLELIIVIAIVVAFMAFFFLLLSLFWAWRFDQQTKDSGNGSDSTTAGTPCPKEDKPVLVHDIHDDDDNTAFECMYPGVVGGTNPTTGPSYPESCISDSEDGISTSLSAYYRSGMGTRPLYTTSRALDDDQVSMSSMESYGYSLDGYAPSLAGTITKPPSMSNLTGLTAAGLTAAGLTAAARQPSNDENEK